METFSTADLVIISVAVIAMAWFGWSILTKDTKGKTPFAGRTNKTSMDEPAPTNTTTTTVQTVAPKTDGK
jgi:hypothetical protein